MVKARCEVAFDRLEPGLLPLLVSLQYRSGMRKELARLKKKNDAGEFPDVYVTLEVKHKKRSLEANALMWATYQFEADCLNGGRIGETGYTADALYNRDLEKYAERKIVKCKYDQVQKVVSDLAETWGHKWAILPALDGIQVVGFKTTSFFDSREIARWIDMRLQTIAMLDVPSDLIGVRDSLVCDLNDTRRMT